MSDSESGPGAGQAPGPTVHFGDSPHASEPAESAEALAADGGMPAALLQEIVTLLERLLEADEDSALDLRSLPLSPADRARLQAALGTGEVTATVSDITGPTEIYETRYQGVWWLRLFDRAGSVSTEQIAITRVPGLLVTHPDDVRRSRARLTEALDSIASGTTMDERPNR